MCLLFGEYLLLAVRFDGNELAARGGFGAQLSSVGEGVTAAAVVLTAGILLSRRALADGLRECAATLSATSWTWLLAHVGLFGISTLALTQVFAFEPSQYGLIITAAAIWGVTGLASLIALARALFGSGAIRLALMLGRISIMGLALGYVAWMLGLASRPLWFWLAEQTLWLVAALLGIFFNGVHVGVADASLGLGGFEVLIAPACSGIEGVALVLVFLTGYLYQFRGDLRFPRALVLLPIAALVAWLSNVVRIAALVVVGAYVSPSVAYGGFHSKAGWLLFCALALSLVFITQRTRFFMREVPREVADIENPTAAYCMPLLVVIAISLFTGLFSAGIDLLYPPRVIGAVSALWYFRHYYRELLVRPGLLGVPVGALVFAIWLVALPKSEPASVEELRTGVLGLSPDARAVWVLFRILGGVLLVPIVEELAFRGFLQRRLIDAEFTQVSLRKLTALSLVGSAVLFGGLHQAWIGGTLAGIGYSLVAFRTGRLVDAVVAHATTNALIAVWVLGFGRWDLWL